MFFFSHGNLIVYKRSNSFMFSNKRNHRDGKFNGKSMLDYVTRIEVNLLYKRISYVNRIEVNLLC